VARWHSLPSDPGASFDRELALDGSTLEPMITYGTNPGMVVAVSGSIPERRDDAVFDQALAYMGLTAAHRLAASRSMSCSSAAAPTAGYRTCAAPPACCAGTRSRAACAR